MILLRGLAPVVLLWAAAFSVKPAEAPPSPSATSARPLPFFYDLYTFREDGGGTEVVVSIAVEARRLQRERTAGQSRYRFDVRFVLADTLLGSVSNTEDSVYLSMPGPLSGGHLLHTYVEVRAEPAAATLQRVVVTDESSGSTVGEGALVMPHQGDWSI